MYYTIEVTHAEGHGYFAKVVEFPGCMAFGDTHEELCRDIGQAMIDWVEVVVEHGDRIPPPSKGPGVSPDAAAFMERFMAEHDEAFRNLADS